VTGADVEVDEPLPDDLATPLARLGLRPATGWWSALDDRAATADDLPHDEG
jgi:hypothetical protein